MRIYDGDRYDTSNKVSDRFLTINACGVSARGNTRTVRTRGRVDHLLLFVEKGELSAVVQGKECVLTAGDFLYYPPMVPQDYTHRSGVYYWVHFAGTCVQSLLSELSGEGARVFSAQSGTAPSHAFERLLYDSSVKNQRTFLPAADFLRLLETLQNGSPPVADHRIRSVVIDMHKNFAKPFDLDLCAKKVYLSKGRFIKKFKQDVGVSPYAYLLSLRFSGAAELLCNSTLSVAEIAASVGFDDPLYFSRAFLKAYGCSPSDYRKKQL